jgi:hypothetical protein
MDLTTIMQLVDDFTGHKWLPAAVVLIGWLTTLLSDTSKFPITIPDRWKPMAVLILGQVYATVQAVAGGVTWPHAVWGGLVAAFGTMGLFDVVVKAIFQGQLPKWLQWLAAIDPNLVAAKRSVGLTSQFFGRAKPSIPPSPRPAGGPPAA